MTWLTRRIFLLACILYHKSGKSAFLTKPVIKACMWVIRKTEGMETITYRDHTLEFIGEKPDDYEELITKFKRDVDREIVTKKYG